MGIFNEFFKKEKPVFTGIARGVGGFGFGGGGGAGGAALTGASGGVKFSSPSYTYHIFVQGEGAGLAAEIVVQEHAAMAARLIALGDDHVGAVGG